MPEITTSRQLRASQLEIWEVISDLTRYEEWNVLHTRWIGEPPSHLAPGTAMTEVVTIKGVVDTIDFVVARYDAPNSIHLTGNGNTGSSVELNFSVQSLDESVSVATLHLVFTSSILIGPLGKIIQRAFGKQLETSLDNLRRLVE